MKKPETKLQKPKTRLQKPKAKTKPKYNAGTKPKLQKNMQTKSPNQRPKPKPKTINQEPETGTKDQKADSDGRKCLGPK